MDLQTQLHKAVNHPESLIKHRESLNARLLDFIAEHILPSTFLADVALVLPLLAVRAPDTVKITLGVISGSWIQWWALHILQRSNVKASASAAAKAETDHKAMTHIANVVDFIADHVAADCNECSGQEDLPPISNPNYDRAKLEKMADNFDTMTSPGHRGVETIEC